VQVNQDGLKLNGTHQLLAYVDDVNVLGGNVHAVKKNTQALVSAAKEIGLKENTDKTQYMVMSRDQNAGRNHNIRIDNISFERVEEFKYFGTNSTIKILFSKKLRVDLSQGMLAITRCRIFCLPGCYPKT
jgi:hypothetical protein